MEKWRNNLTKEISHDTVSGSHVIMDRSALNMERAPRVLGSVQVGRREFAFWIGGEEVYFLRILYFTGIWLCRQSESVD